MAEGLFDRSPVFNSSGEVVGGRRQAGQRVDGSNPASGLPERLNPR